LGKSIAATEVRMTRRLSWILLHLALALGALPGCQIFSGRRNVAGTDSPPPPQGPTQTAVTRETPTPTPKEVATRPTEKPAKVDEAPPGPRVSFTPPPVDKGEPLTAASTETAPEPKAVKPPPPLVQALQCMLEDRHQEALQHLQAYDQETQEFFLRVLPTLTIFAKKRWNEVNSQEVAVLDDQLRNLLTQLRSRTELSIDKMCTCEWIKAYGIYRPLRDNHSFLAAAPGRPGDLVQLYVELRNFASELRDSFYETRLSSSVEIHDARGTLRWAFSFDDNKQPLKSLTRLHDYFNNYSFYVPELEPGTYQLTVQVVDETLPGNRRVTRKSLDFRVSANSAQATR
jgi:hypothetical protein